VGNRLRHIVTDKRSSLCVMLSSGGLLLNAVVQFLILLSVRATGSQPEGCPLPMLDVPYGVQSNLRTKCPSLALQNGMSSVALLSMMGLPTSIKSVRRDVLQRPSFHVSMWWSESGERGSYA
jgi:hypothetical protein